MMYATESITTASLSLALDTAALQHRAIAYNIANAGVEGFQPLRLQFSEHLANARNELEQGRKLTEKTLADLAEPMSELGFSETSGSPFDRVQLDSEVAKMAQNAVQYQALLRGLSRHLSILSTAVSDGKR